MSAFFMHKHVDHMLINFKVDGWRLVKEKKNESGVVFLLSFKRKSKSLIADKDLIKGSNVYLYFYRMPDVYEWIADTVHIYCIEELGRWILFG